MNRRDWNTGFTDGYLACLAAMRGHFTGDCTEFKDAVAAFGSTATLLNRARKLDDIVLPDLRKAVKAINARRKLIHLPHNAEKADG